MRPGLLRSIALLIVAMLMAAVLSPVYEFAHGYGPQAEVTRLTGWSLPAFGWLGPLALSFAWYANPMLLLILVRLARGKPPGRTLPLVALGLALTVLVPALVYDFERDGRLHPTFIAGPGVWLWIGAYVVAGLVCVQTRNSSSQPGRAVENDI